MKKRHILIPLLLLCMLLPLGAVGAQEKTYSADRFVSAVVVEEGGALLVTETIDFNFVGGPFTFVFRELPTDNSDGIVIVEASVDGVTYPTGEDAGQVEIETGNPTRVTWHFEPMSNTERSVQLVYRMNGVVRPEDGTDALHWQPLPDSYEYEIGASETTITYPARTSLVAEPMIEAGSANIAETANQVIYTTGTLEPDTPLVVLLQFAEGSLITDAPEWLARREANAARLPYWIGAAVLLFGTGALGAVPIWRRNRVSADSKALAMSPPSDLSPALAGLLVTHGTTLSWTHAQGTLFQLAEEGVVVIEELDEKKWYRPHDFAVKRVDPKTRKIPHEEALLTLLFEDEKIGRTQSTKFSEMSSKINGKAWKAFKEQLEAESKLAGFHSAARQKARNGMIGFAIFLFVLGMPVIVLSAIFSDALGFGPMTIAIALELLGLVILSLGLSLAPLSDVGAERAVAWKQFYNYIKAISNGKQAIDSPTMFEKHLPYAAAFGLLQPWSKQFEKAGWTEPPAYFHTIPGTANNGWASFVAMQGAISSSGGSAGGAGAAGAGAAGGGASGAG